MHEVHMNIISPHETQPYTENEKTHIGPL